eukprot:4594938-Amphidinium_carterae.2
MLHVVLSPQVDAFAGATSNRWSRIRGKTESVSELAPKRTPSGRSGPFCHALKFVKGKARKLKAVSRAEVGSKCWLAVAGPGGRRPDAGHDCVTSKRVDATD